MNASRQARPPPSLSPCSTREIPPYLLGTSTDLLPLSPPHPLKVPNASPLQSAPMVVNSPQQTSR